MKTFCVANQKGGVGKSTVTVNCIYVAIERKLRVLLVDLDPQAVEHLFGTIKRVKRELNPKLRHAGILLVKTNSRSREETEALATLREAYGSAILAGTLPERAAVKASVALMRPVWKNVRGSSHRKAAEEWHTVCNEIIDGVLDEK